MEVGRGHTLIELAVVMSVAALLAAASAPMLARWLASSGVDAAVDALLSDLAYARHQAVMRASTVYLCKSADQRHCAADVGWHDGWIVFEDTDGDRQRGGTEPLLRARDRLAAPVQVSHGGLSRGRYVRYLPLGTAWPNSTFTFCTDAAGRDARAVVFYQSGRPRVASSRSDGGPLDCGWYGS